MVITMKKRILFLPFLFILVLAIKIYPQEHSSSSVQKYTLDNCINHFDISKSIKTDSGYQYWFVDKDFADGKTLKLSVVGPNQATHLPHKHIEDEFYFILEGTAEVYLDGNWKKIESNTSFYCPSNIEHGIRNPGVQELKYLVIKKYEKK
jgi:mannose-6-phosphate isomerase-like protein (cupin superfamily)